MEPVHEFTLIVDGISELNPEVMDALFEAGCDDATVSRQGETVSMDFARSAPTLKDAIASAIANVRHAGIGARVVRVDEVAQGPYTDESTSMYVCAVNSALHVSHAVTLDPTIRHFVLELLERPQ